MKKITQILMLFLGLSGIVKAQDFEPSQQAQGLLESKNVTVDYSTGIFHYKVPLYTLKSGDYELPISLDYTGKGVKVEDSSGLVGYNWTLNTGGVVTRTIRGGIADEDINGYLNTNPEMLRTNSIEIHKRSWDGECDIFTAVFNGQSVQFILQRKEGHLYGEPLERSNVRIEVLQGGLIINGFIVTDENGNRYIYRQKEWSSDINKEDAISFNGVRNKSYISSWYLSRIEPLNGEPILYTYRENVNSEGEQNDIYVSQYTNTYKSKYHYGKPMRERPFDFSKYKDAFNANMERAKYFIGEVSSDFQYEHILKSFDTSTDWLRNPSFGKELDGIDTNCRVLGELANFQNIAKTSTNLIQSLLPFQEYYAKLGTYNGDMAAQSLGSAISRVIQTLEDTILVSEKDVNNITTYEIRSPLLSRIRCGDQIVEFSKYGRELKLQDLSGKRISEYQLKSKGSLLGKLLLLDKDSIITSQIQFDYYDLPDKTIPCKADLWGYPKAGGNDDDYISNIDSIYSKWKSLKTIILENQGTIQIDYQSNEVSYNQRDRVPFGGIRVKSLIINDELSNNSDTIRYNYMSAGTLTIAHINSDGNGIDSYIYSRMKLIGPAFTQMGNNGLYYTNVQEEISNKGMNVYVFYMPTYYGDTHFPYTFWLNALPLATASYDQNRNLKRLIKNRYYTDIPSGCQSTDFADYFIQGDSLFTYRQCLPQVKAYEYYLDEEKVKQYYLDQGDVVLYVLYKPYMINPYKETYLPNIEPRVTKRIPDFRYNLYMGGATLLKEKLEYHYESSLMGNMSLADILAPTSDIPFMKTEYYYDNKAHSVRPTRIVQTDSRNHVQTKIIKRVTEMDNEADSVFIKMKERNIINPVVKELTIRDGRVLNESVSCFQLEAIDNIYGLGVSKKYKFTPSVPTSYQYTSMDNCLFIYEPENYILENSFIYKLNEHSYAPANTCSRTGNVITLYDPFNKLPNIIATHIPLESVSVLDMKKYDTEVVNKIGEYKEYYDALHSFYQVYLNKHVNNVPQGFEDYIQSNSYKMIIEFIRSVSDLKFWGNTAESLTLLKELRADNNADLIEFVKQYGLVFSMNPDLGYTDYEFRLLVSAFLDVTIVTPQFFDSAGLYLYLKSTPEKLSVTNIQEDNYLRLYILSKGASKIIPYTIKHSGGTTMKEINVPSASHYTVQTADIDISSYTGIISVDIDRTDDVVYIVLVPAGVSFEATSYNLDRSVFAKFDQTGKLEVNEYDSAGRLIRITDENGNTVKEQTYNIVNY